MSRVVEDIPPLSHRVGSATDSVALHRHTHSPETHHPHRARAASRTRRPGRPYGGPAGPGWRANPSPAPQGVAGMLSSGQPLQGQCARRAAPKFRAWLNTRVTSCRRIQSVTATANRSAEEVLLSRPLRHVLSSTMCATTIGKGGCYAIWAVVQFL